MKFAAIVPTAYMFAVNAARRREDSFHLFLAHLCLKDETYINRCVEACGRKILDNSYFELGYSLDADTLLRIANKIKASAVVLEDDTTKNFNAFYREGYDCYLVPHKIDTLLKFAKMAAKDEGTYLCISHIAAQKIAGGKPFGVSNRYKVLNILKEKLSAENFNALIDGKIHFLGLGDNPKVELAQIKNTIGNNFTCDSSMFLYPFISSGGEKRFEDIALKSKSPSIDFDFKNQGGSFELKVAEELRRLTKILA